MTLKEKKAWQYAQSITKNETYQKYLVDACIAMWDEALDWAVEHGATVTNHESKSKIVYMFQTVIYNKESILLGKTIEAQDET